MYIAVVRGKHVLYSPQGSDQDRFQLPNFLKESKFITLGWNFQEGGLERYSWLACDVIIF